MTLLTALTAPDVPAVLSVLAEPGAVGPSGVHAPTWHLPGAWALSQTFRVLDLSGVFLNGILGGLIARRKNFDLVGFFVLAILTATGGGILRDVMIQAGPPFALTDPYYLVMACAGALAAWWVSFRSRLAGRFLVVADAIVLGTWAATGATKALANDLGVMPALLLGCLTAVGGSMIRDVSVGETPAVFGGNRLYAVPALCAALTDVALVGAGAPSAWAMLVATLVGAGMCLLAYWRSWRLPVSADVERRRQARRQARTATRGVAGPADCNGGAGAGGTVRSGWRRALLWRTTPPLASARQARPGTDLGSGGQDAPRRRQPLDPQDL